MWQEKSKLYKYPRVETIFQPRPAHLSLPLGKTPERRGLLWNATHSWIRARNCTLCPFGASSVLAGKFDTFPDLDSLPMLIKQRRKILFTGPTFVFLRGDRGLSLIVRNTRPQNTHGPFSSPIHSTYFSSSFCNLCTCAISFSASFKQKWKDYRDKSGRSDWTGLHTSPTRLK